MEEKNKPVFDEQILAKLLEAAYVVQEHNRKLQALGLRAERHDRPDEVRPDEARPAPLAPPIPASADGEAAPSQSAPAATEDYTLTLTEIVETQRQIQLRQLELDQAIALVGERVTAITRAGGAAIGLLADGKIRYQATAGQMTLPPGTEIPAEKSLCAVCLRNGQIVRCEDISLESSLDVEECQRRGIQSIIAVPVYQSGGIAGGLEIYYASKHVFTEQDIHTCQLMAGLLTEALARRDELARKKSLANDRSKMLEDLQKLKPDLDALVSASAARESAAWPRDSAPAHSTSTFPCRKCGHELVGAEQFCGNCGSPRGSEHEPSSVQNKVAPLSHPPQAQQKNLFAVLAHDGATAGRSPRVTFDESQPEKALADALEQEVPEFLGAPGLRITEASPSAEFAETPAGTGVANRSLALSAETIEDGEAEDGPSSDTAQPNRETASTWTSAATAREFLEQLAAARPSGAMARFWHSRRGDVYLAVAVILVACVIRWGIWSNHSVSATTGQTTAAAHRKPTPDADLSLFDQMLVKLGLAEAPEPPEYKGNPETQVWVDLHTALYYCPGADLYGKTPKGKFTTQRDAQLDRFEPAYQKACN